MVHAICVSFKVTHFCTQEHIFASFKVTKNFLLFSSTRFIALALMFRFMIYLKLIVLYGMAYNENLSIPILLSLCLKKAHPCPSLNYFCIFVEIERTMNMGILGALSFIDLYQGSAN